MKKLLAIIVMGLLIMSGFSGCKGKSTVMAFKGFETQEGGFTVLLPDKPVRKVQTVDSALGPTDVVMYSVEKSNIAYAVMYNEVPKEVEKNGLQEKALENARDTLVKDSGFKIIKESKVSLGKAQGKEVIIEGGSENSKVHHRMYIINNRLYQVMVEIKNGKYAEFTKEIETFLNSFRTINN